MGEQLAAYAMPVLVTLAGCLMLFGKQEYFNAFSEGAFEGLRSAVRLLPTLSALMVAISMLNASGAIDFLAQILAPVASALGVPQELLPLLVTRPFSGSASTAAFDTLLQQVGADSQAGLCASVIFGSSDTVFYILSVYFSSVGVRHTRHALLSALSVMLFCIFFSCFLCRIWFF